MTVKELIKKLSKYDDDLDVIIWDRLDDNSNISWIAESGAKDEYKELVIATDLYDLDEFISCSREDS